MDRINQVRVEFPHAGLSKIPFGAIFKYVDRLIIEKRNTKISPEKRMEIIHLAQQLIDEQTIKILRHYLMMSMDIIKIVNQKEIKTQKNWWIKLSK